MSSIKAAVTAEAKTESRSPLEGEPKSRSDFGGGAARSAALPLPEAPSGASTLPQGEGGRVFASPLAKRIAEQKGIDLAAVSGSGPRGRIVKSDVENAQPGTAKKSPHPEEARSAVSKGAPSEAPAALPDARLFYSPDDYVELPHDSMRKAIAKRLSASASGIPHFYLTIDCRIDALLGARKRLNDASPKGPDGKTAAYKLSVNDFLVKAAALALIKSPDVNASWTDSAVLRHKHADVGVAVALDFGLITPIVFRAEGKGLAAISNEVKVLAERARTKKLKPQEYEGGTFSISNLGMFGIGHFTALINPPQAAILAVGAGVEKAIIVDGKVEVATVMTVTMSCDHRVIDGATGSRFLQVFKKFVEDPAAMLL
jgi:pyruvate dehydrogenase E2 component (dihydrolipoamide acetyltransferase)